MISTSGMRLCSPRRISLLKFSSAKNRMAISLRRGGLAGEPTAPRGSAWGDDLPHIRDETPQLQLPVRANTRQWLRDGANSNQWRDKLHPVTTRGTVR